MMDHSRKYPGTEKCLFVWNSFDSISSQVLFLLRSFSVQ